MTKIEEAKFERFINLLAELIMKYGESVLEGIEKKNKDCSVGKSAPNKQT